MAGEWRKARIEEVAERVAMGPFGSSIKVETFVSSGVPVISGQHLHGAKVDDSVGYNFISEHHADRLKNANVQRGDVIFTHAGNIGQVAYIPEASQFERYVISQRQFYMRCDRSKVIPEFVVAYFKTPEGQHRLLANTSQVGVPSIAQPVTYLRTVEIPLPPLPEQRAIAHILGTLDDKIELNRRMSETLEVMARALFKSWFVDFGPVRAKLKGRWRRGESLPGLPAHFYDLFPDRLVDSELGEIPEGWGVAPLTEIVDVNPTRSLHKGQIAPYLDMANMPTRGHVPTDVVNREFGSGMRFVNGDTLLARITPCLENGKTAFVDFLGEGQVGWGSTEYIVLRPKPPLPEEYAYCLARSDVFREFVIQSMTGTSGRQRVQANSLGHFQLVRVPKLVGAMFGRSIKPLFALSSAVAQESRTLAALRDALLPKLISGELRVKDAEKFIGGTLT
jgi:type I restriction enzyme S subunit